MRSSSGGVGGGGLPQIVDDSVGGLFPPGDPEALAAKILELVSAGGLAERGATGHSSVVAKWSNERLVDRHLAVHRGLGAG